MDRKLELGRHGRAADRISDIAAYSVVVCLLQNRDSDGIQNVIKSLLFGMGRNAIGSNAFPCARQATLERLPGDM